MNDKLRELAEKWNSQAAQCLRNGMMAPVYDKGMANSYQQCVHDVLAILDAEGDGGAVAWVADLAPGIERPKNYMGIFTPYKSYADSLAKYNYYVVTPLYTHPARSGVVSDEDVRDSERWRYLVRENNKGGRGAFRIVWFDEPGDGFITTDGVSVDGKDEQAIVRIVDAAIQGERRD